MASELMTGNNSGSQTATQSPQISAPAESATATAGSVQPGTATELLNGQNGIALSGGALSTVSLGGSSQTQPALHTGAASAPRPHHVNAVLLSFPVALFVVAIVLYWAMTHSVKNTTN